MKVLAETFGEYAFSEFLDVYKYTCRDVGSISKLGGQETSRAFFP